MENKVMRMLKDRLQVAMDEATPPMTGAELARALGVSKTAVSKWLNGTTTSMKSDILARAADKLKVSSKWLADGKGPKRNLLVTETANPYTSKKEHIEAMRRATRFVVDNVGINSMADMGADWTADTILKLFELFLDPGSAQLNEDTILKLIQK